MPPPKSSDVADRFAVKEPLVLAVDDESGILRMIRLELSSQGLRVLTATSGAEGLLIAKASEPDIVLIDIVMQGMSGLELLTELKLLSAAPVILLTAKGSDEDRVRGLALGADDYISKPFRPEELSNRVRAALRRNPGESTEDQILRVGTLQIDLGRHLVLRSGDVIPLTPTEWKLLEQLAMRAGSMVSNEQLLGAVWGAEYREDLQYLRIWIARLQRKLRDDVNHPQLITARDDHGFELSAPGAGLARSDIA